MNGRPIIAAALLAACVTFNVKSQTPAPEEKAAPEQSSFEGIEPVKTDSGLVYYDLVKGTGEQPLPSALVTVHYTGWLKSDGTLFDSSHTRPPFQPAKFKLHQVIPGWTEGVGSMKVGGKRRLEIPSNLAYGERDTPTIPANSDLIFEVELLEVVQPEQIPSHEGLELVTTESGLKYYDLKKGSGDPVGSEATVLANIIIWLEDGTVVISTKDQGRPGAVKLSNFQIKGVAEGMAGMGAGGSRKMIVPPELAFGEAGQGSVPPDATMIVVAEIVEEIKQRSVEGIEPVTTESGLKYVDIKKGTGETPSGPNANVTVHYTGWLQDGTVFDSSKFRGEPAQFRLDGVIKGWTEGVQSMSVGGIRRLEIPADLAYGAEGRPGIPPNSELIFEVELTDVKNPPPPPPTTPEPETDASRTEPEPAPPTP
jgi:FKBP-type peptidyl-prolyl cis-trans isomerase